MMHLPPLEGDRIGPRQEQASCPLPSIVEYYFWIMCCWMNESELQMNRYLQFTNIIYLNLYLSVMEFQGGEVYSNFEAKDSISSHYPKKLPSLNHTDRLNDMKGGLAPRA